MLAWMPQFLRADRRRGAKLHAVQFERNSSGAEVSEVAYLNSDQMRAAPAVRASTTRSLLILTLRGARSHLPNPTRSSACCTTSRPHCRSCVPRCAGCSGVLRTSAPGSTARTQSFSRAPRSRSGRGKRRRPFGHRARERGGSGWRPLVVVAPAATCRSGTPSSRRDDRWSAGLDCGRRGSSDGRRRADRQRRVEFRRAERHRRLGRRSASRFAGRRCLVPSRRRADSRLAGQGGDFVVTMSGEHGKVLVMTSWESDPCRNGPLDLPSSTSG